MYDFSLAAINSHLPSAQRACFADKTIHHYTVSFKQMSNTYNE